MVIDQVLVGVRQTYSKEMWIGGCKLKQASAECMIGGTTFGHNTVSSILIMAGLCRGRHTIVC